MSQPRASRPHMPGYGLPGPEEGEGLLAWSWAEERITASHNYWVATTRPDGRPHAMAVWGLWLEGTFQFSCSATSRKARNIAANPHCVVTTEGAEEAVVVEGRAEQLRDRATLDRFVAEYKTKYDWEMDPTQEGYFIVRPDVTFGFIEHGDQFAATATRWTFDRA